MKLNDWLTLAILALVAATVMAVTTSVWSRIYPRVVEYRVYVVEENGERKPIFTERVNEAN